MAFPEELEELANVENISSLVCLETLERFKVMPEQLVSVGIFDPHEPI